MKQAMPIGTAANALSQLLYQHGSTDCYHLVGVNHLKHLSIAVSGLAAMSSLIAFM